MRVLIYGNPKSGSTALAYDLKESLPEHDLLFEPKTLSLVPRLAKNIIVKYFWQDEDHGEGVFAEFDKRILLIRHPLDFLLSWVIYKYSTDQRILSDHIARPLLEKFLELEANLIDFRDVYNCGPGLLNIRDNAFTQRLAGITKVYEDAEKDFFFVLRYEDFVDGALSGLSEFLGTPVVRGQVDRVHEHVARSKRAGNWTRWLTPDDVEYFRGHPEVARYAEAFSYDLTFPENARLDRSPREGSAYVAKQIDRVRKRNGVAPLDFHSTANLAEMHLMKAADALADGDAPTAIEWGTSAALSGSPYALCYVLAARGMIAQGRYLAAETAARRAVEIAPWFANAWHWLAEALSKQDRLTEALVAARTAVEHDPLSAEHHMLLSSVLLKSRKWEEAEAAVRAALGCSNYAKSFHKSLAAILWELGRQEEALQEVDTAIRFNPDVWHYYTLKAQICLDLRRTEDAAAALAFARAQANTPESEEVIASIEKRLKATKPRPAPAAAQPRVSDWWRIRRRRGTATPGTEGGDTGD